MTKTLVYFWFPNRHGVRRNTTPPTGTVIARIGCIMGAYLRPDFKK